RTRRAAQQRVPLRDGGRPVRVQRTGRGRDLHRRPRRLRTPPVQGPRASPRPLYWCACALGAFHPGAPIVDATSILVLISSSRARRVPSIPPDLEFRLAHGSRMPYIATRERYFFDAEERRKS